MGEAESKTGGGAKARDQVDVREPEPGQDEPAPRMEEGRGRAFPECFVFSFHCAFGWEISEIRENEEWV